MEHPGSWARVRGGRRACDSGLRFFRKPWCRDVCSLVGLEISSCVGAEIEGQQDSGQGPRGPTPRESQKRVSVWPRGLGEFTVTDAG